MKLTTRFNFLSIAIVLASTVLALGVGTVILNDLLYRFEEYVLRTEVTNAREVMRRALIGVGVQPASAAAADLQAQLRQKEGLQSAELFIVALPDDSIVYHPTRRAGTRLATDFVERMSRKGTGVIEYYASGDVPHFAAFTTLEPPNWLIAISVDKNEMLASRGVFLRAIGGTAFLLLSINAVVLNFFGRRLMRRMRATLDCVNRIERGELSARIPAITAQDEFGKLQEGINAMSARIEERTLALREQEARVRQLVESNIIGVLFWDADGRITEANDAFLTIVGRSREELRSGTLRWTDLTPPEYHAADTRAMEELTHESRFTPFEKAYLRKDGSRVPVLIGGAHFEGSQHRGVAFVLDLTERKQMETERGARRAAEAANRAKSDFLAHMSHELRTPLNAILGYSQILRQDKALDPRQIDGLSIIQRSGEHLLSLINDILDMAKIEAGKVELNLSDIPPERFLRFIAETIRVKASEKGLSFVYDVAPDLPTGVRLDEKRLRQVLLNLLSNAVKFTERGSVRLRVGFTPPGQLNFAVEDTGIGIDEAHLEAIFRPFEQVDEARRWFGGTGLGLAISRQLVRLMGGEIHVESHPGRGSTFSFALDVPIVEPQAAPVPPEWAVNGYEGPRKAVLVADDVAENRAVAVEMLGRLGFEMIEAGNGVEALEKAEALRPALILMDVVMPEMDGLEATRRLRELPEFSGLPIIAISASASGTDAEKCRAAGASAFLAKPIDFNGLLAEVAMLLKVQWTYELPKPQVTESLETAEHSAGVPGGPLITPPPEEIEALYQLARLGNMRAIVQHAAHLIQLDERFRPFADQLCLLAKGYRSKAILSLVEHYLEKRQSS
ncbi:ATP-binding protein [Burkholderia sp. MR1-5-21]